MPHLAKTQQLINTTRRITPDEQLSRRDRFSAFWREIFKQASDRNASDIHVEPMQDGLRVRLRLSGTCQTVMIERDHDIVGQLIDRLKFIAQFDIGVRNITQDRCFCLEEFATRYRACLTPGGQFGERIVFRTIRDDDIPDLDNLDMTAGFLRDLRWAIQQPQGFLLVTGPTGSGKSTTLQAAIMEIDREENVVATIEDPIERILPSVAHEQISPYFGWKDAIKAAMRQNPNVILIGEIRDRESAELALEASQTGHLVMSTLHTNDVASTVDRLITLGLERHLIADCLLFVSAQRLLKRLCVHCRLPASANTFTRNHHGCERCRGMGISGRVAVVEYVKKPDPGLVYDFDKEKMHRACAQTLSQEVQRLITTGIVDQNVFGMY